MPERLHPEVHQVGGADQLHHRVDGDRPLHQGAEAGRHQQDLGVGAAGVAHDGEHRGPAAEGHAPAHHEHDARARDDDQQEGRRREGQQRMGRHHGVEP